MWQAAHACGGLEAACLFCGDVLDYPAFPEPCHAVVWLPADDPGSPLDDVLVFANLTLASGRLLHGPEHADPQLPVHLVLLRSVVLGWLLPLLKLKHAASDGWLSAGIAGWLALRWVERAVGDDAARLSLQRLNDAVSVKGV